MSFDTSNIVNGSFRSSGQWRTPAGPWRVPVVREDEFSLALKAMKNRPFTPRTVAVEALKRVGKKSNWITDDELRAVAAFQRTPLFHLQATKRRIDSWLSSLDDYVERVIGQVEPADSVLKYQGGVPTALVLAGNDFTTAPLILTHCLLAETRLIVKTSGVDPITPFLFLKALHEEGVQSVQLLHLDASTEEGRDQVRRVIENTNQSVVFGEDSTVAAVYDGVAGNHWHKKIPFWTGRSGAIVLGDCDLEVAARDVVESATWNSGRSCVSTKKVFCANSIASELTRAVLSEADRLRRLPYTDYYCDLGPQDEEARQHITKRIPAGDLLYDNGLIVAGCSAGSALLKEEYPYPVVGIVAAEEHELVDLANATVSGTPSGRAMQMAVYSRDRTRFDDIAAKLAAYKVTWNGTTNPFWIYHPHQGMYFFHELMWPKAICAGRPTMFENGRPLTRPWPW